MLTEQEIQEHAKQHSIHIDKINAMSIETIDALVAAGNCPYEPQHLLGVPIGMFHCPLCGEMVMAGFTHPKPMTPEEEAAYNKEVEDSITGSP